MPLRKILARVRRAEEGFSMVVTMGAVSLMLVSSAVAVTSVQSDQDIGRKDRDRKAAYSAAEAGLQVYVHRLLNDNTYWAQCDAEANDGVNQPWIKSGANPTDPRDWEPLSDNSAQWTTEVIPVSGKSQCDKNDPEGTMVQAGTPTFRIRVTGQALVTDAATGKQKAVGPKRSLIATFKRKSFLDYIYFTDLEVTDPTIYGGYIARGWETKERAGEDPAPAPKQRTLAEWGNVACGQYSYVKAIANKSDGLQYRMDQRYRVSPPTSGKRPYGSTSSYQSITGACSEITFSDGDWIQGPMHTNDTSQLCGNPKFGRSPADVIEISGPGDTSVTDVRKSWRVSSQNGCSGATPDVNFEGDLSPDPNVGTWKYNQKLLKLPSSNLSLKAEAPTNYTFRGRTLIRLTNTGVTVTGKDASGTVLNNKPLPYPENGVIYVDNDPTPGNTCTATYDTMTADDPRPGCGIAVVKGTYDTSLTIAAADDIIIDGNIIREDGAPAVLGMVSNNFIRLNHPVVDQDECAQGNNSANGVGALTNPRVDSALLALKHSFLVDNWACGLPLGTLTVNGAIAQKFRGPVGTGSGKTMSTGYYKLYKYDDRLRVRVPPKFIDPVESAWGIQTYQEQSPAQ